MTASKDKNEPGRFLGEGVSFRAKLIGVLEVPEARGDRMCQEALADLKMAIRAAGEHKQRIQVHVAIDGLRLRDDKTGDSLYHHPVHKISFIAQDMTDSRAFGYIFGSPDTGHRFFGIKTDKAASQVVIAMRDLFQVVFELKKKEVELAKQQLEGKTVSTSLSRHTSAVSEPKVKSLASVSESSTSASKAEAEGGVAELVDLEQELCSLRRGLTQVEGLTPSTDPFGDSFIIPAQSTKGLLPPPPPSGASSRGRNTPSSRVFSPSKGPLPFDLAAVAADFDPQPTSLVDNSLPEPVQAGASAALSYHVFTELDPLGTGRSKPYVDKKLFFQELKNPPKKVLKDLVPATNAPPHAQSLLSEILPDTKSEPQYGPSTTMTSLTRHSGGTVSIAKPSYTTSSNNFYSADPFAETDPFDNSDPFVDSFKDDPFTSMAEFPKSILRVEELKSKLSREPTLDKVEKAENSLDSMKSVFNGPLQVSLPPEPVPKSPRLQRQNTDSSSVRQRPQPISKLGVDNASPPPPLPPKKIAEISVSRPPPRPPHDYDDNSDAGPPLPRPARKKEPLADRSIKPRLSSQATNSSEDEYLTPAPPPLPSARRFDITLSQLLVCTMPELAARLRVPETTLSSMTLPQLTEYLRSYLAADNERAHIHIETGKKSDKNKPSITVISSIPSITPTEKPTTKSAPLSEFKPQFEDNFTPPDSFASSDTFVANFDDFDIKASASYDRYAAFREIQELELKSKSIFPVDSPTRDEPKQDSDEKEELAAINNLMIQEVEDKETSKSPLKSLDELTLDSFNMFRNSVSPKPTQPIEAKIEDIKSVMKNLQIDKSRRSVSPRENNVEFKIEDANDRYAALREITIIEPQDEFESLPPEVPKERKRSDEKSDGFDNSDFFDCIDNSSLSFSHVEDAFRKSPVVKIEEVIGAIMVEEKKESLMEPPPPARDLREVRETLNEKDTRDARDLRDTMDTRDIKDLRDTINARELRDNREIREVRDLRDTRNVREPVVPARMSTGSISDVASGSSPDTKDKCVTSRATTRAGRWAVLGATGASPWSSDSRESEPRPRRRRGPPHHSPPESRPGIVQTSSSSRDVSPWDEDPPHVTRLPRPPSHHRDRDRESRHGSSGSRECLDSGSGREKDKRDKRDSRDREISREGGRDSVRDRRDSGSGRDRRDSKERDIREHRDRRDRRSRDRDRDRESDSWDRDRTYSRDRDYRDSRSRERKDYRDKDRDRHRKPRHSYDEDEDYSDGCGSGSSPRDRWPDQRWRRDERNYGSLGWRESRRRNEIRHIEDPSDRRYGSTLGWGPRSARGEGRRGAERDPLPRERDPLSRERDPLPRERDPLPRERDPLPRERDPLPRERDPLPRERDPLPRERDPLPRERDPLPRERDPLPRERDPLPRERDPLPRERDPLPRERDPRRRQRRDDQRRPRNDYRFSNDFSPREREHTSPFDTDFNDSTPKDYIPTPATKKRAPYSSLEGTRFSFEPEESPAGASPLSSCSARARDGDTGSARFRFDSDSLSPRSMFEDDFTNLPRGRTASIAEEEECDVPPLRAKPQSQHRDIKKSESVNIFTREADPFEGDAFFACTGSDRAARREHWPGDLHA